MNVTVHRSELGHRCGRYKVRNLSDFP